MQILSSTKHKSVCLCNREPILYLLQNRVSVLGMIVLYSLHVAGSNSHQEHREDVARSTDTALSFRLALPGLALPPVLLSLRITWSRCQWHENYTIFLNLPCSWETLKSLKMGNLPLKICKSPNTYYQHILSFSISGMFLKSFRWTWHNHISLREA